MQGANPCPKKLKEKQKSRRDSMNMYQYVQEHLDKYEGDYKRLSFYESICGDLCKYCKHSDKGEPAYKCTNGFCWNVVFRAMKYGKPEEKDNEQLSLF